MGWSKSGRKNGIRFGDSIKVVYTILTSYIYPTTHCNHMLHATPSGQEIAVLSTCSCTTEPISSISTYTVDSILFSIDSYMYKRI